MAIVTFYLDPAESRVFKAIHMRHGITRHALATAIVRTWLRENGAQAVVNGAQADEELQTMMHTEPVMFQLDQDALRSARLSRGLTMPALADAVGLRYQNYQRIESGKRPNPSVDIAARLAKALDVPIASLLREVPGESQRKIKARERAQKKVHSENSP